MKQYLEETMLLDYGHKSFDDLFESRKWSNLDEYSKIRAIYDFVRDDIRFGYNSSDDRPASRILQDGYGQCNTKGILLMALLRKAGISCRFHGFTIDKKLQKGAITGIWYVLSPRSIVHSWVEVLYQGKWLNLEGFIIDVPYLTAIQRRYPDTSAFCGFGIASKDLQNPEIFWDGNDTYIQKEGINKDFGIFDNPDDFFAQTSQNLGPVKSWLFRFVVRKVMNRTVGRIRKS